MLTLLVMLSLTKTRRLVHSCLRTLAPLVIPGKILLTLTTSFRFLSFERVCPQLQSLQTELKTLRAEMRICEAKIDHYSGQLKRVQNEVYELHR